MKHLMLVVLAIWLTGAVASAETFRCEDQEAKGTGDFWVLFDGPLANAKAAVLVKKNTKSGEFEVLLGANYLIHQADGQTQVGFVDGTPVDWSKVPAERCWTGHGTAYHFEMNPSGQDGYKTFIQPMPHFAVRPNRPNCFTPKLQVRGGYISYCTKSELSLGEAH